MNIDLKQPIKTLKGESYKTGDNSEELTLGLVIAEVLANDGSGGKMKMWTLAQTAYKKDSMEIDAADVALIKRAIESSKVYGGNTIILGQSLQLLEEAK